MTAMKGFTSILLLFIAFASGSLSAAQHPAPQIRKVRTVMTTDTVTRTDTIVTQEVVRTHNLITTVEEVIRVDTIVHSNGKTYTIRGKEFPSAFSASPLDGLYPGGDSVRIVVRDTVFLPSGPELPVREGGSYVWVPDSLSQPVADVIAGKTGPVVRLREYDDKELVTFRGDTIPMMLRDRNFGRFDRGLFNYLFIPKGVWQIGMTASYGEISTKDLEILDLMSDVDISGRIFSIRPYFSYFIRNNLSVGMRFAYTSGRGNIDSFQVDIDDDMNFNLKDIMYRSESYSASLTLSQYFGIARRGRFGVFNEVELAFASGNSDFRRPYNGEPKLTHTTTTQASLNFSPGLSVFMMDQVAFNVSFGVFGFYLKNEKQKVDGIDSGDRFTSGANFRFNIFNINFGIAVSI